jgi:hypothetical protein
MAPAGGNSPRNWNYQLPFFNELPILEMPLKTAAVGCDNPVTLGAYKPRPLTIRGFFMRNVWHVYGGPGGASLGWAGS